MTRRDLASSLGLLGTGACIRIESALSEPTVPVMIRAEESYYAGPAADPVRHKLDLYLPGSPPRSPILLFFHGGGWSFGRKDTYRRLGERFASLGYRVVIPNYRLSPTVRHPEHVRDAARAVAWTVRESARWGGDPGQLYLSGHSAGGHLAALLALDPRYLREVGLAPRIVQGVIGISGPYHLGARGFEAAFGDDPVQRRDASPATHVADIVPTELPRFLLLAAERDPLPLRVSAQSLATALSRRGGDCTRFQIPERTHVSIVARLPETGDPAAARIHAFLAAARHGR